MGQDGELQSRRTARRQPQSEACPHLSLREAMQLGNDNVGTEHLLLGLIQEGEGVGVQVLQSFGIEPSRVRRQVLGLLGGIEMNVGEGANRFPHRVGEPKCAGCGADLTKAARYRSMTIPPTIPHLPPIAVEAVVCGQCGVLVGMFKADLRRHFRWRRQSKVASGGSAPEQ